MGERVKFTTSVVEPRHRLDLWRSTLASSMAAFEMNARHARDFDAEVVAVEVGKIKILQFSVPAFEIARPNALIRKDGCDDYVIGTSIDGTTRHSLDSSEIPMRLNNIVLFDLAKTYECQHDQQRNCITVQIPRDLLDRALGPAPRLSGLSIGPEQACGPTICGFFRSLMENGHLFDPSTADRMASIGVDLLAAGFAERLGYEPRTGLNAAALVYRAKVLIGERLCEAELDSAAIAGAMGVSLRRLQQAFAEQNLTVDSFIWERRLAKACTQLRDPAYDAISVAMISYAVGFSNQAHFARRFRARYAVTPTEYRALARLDRMSGITTGG